MSTNAAANPLPLKDRVAIVTESSHGMGKVITTHLAELGAKVVVKCTSSSDQADQVKYLFDSAEQAFGRLTIHVLVNSTGDPPDSGNDQVLFLVLNARRKNIRV
ncbi:hypothetical protein COLO4_25195 [Corchorus olitorius]|uniref:Short-chain dehydrogenase/reductase SDR n=1 Tax=Corchorus olitorius TaxID=93759 RepID=A0A1R3I4E6_9ROSI|nr:hypothetical protein COLO4_25195 [Corchorus olitorius]